MGLGSLSLRLALPGHLAPRYDCEAGEKRGLAARQTDLSCQRIAGCIVECMCVYIYNIS